MLINEDTRIKELLEARGQEVINALIDLNSNFSKLNNPLLRNLFARRITIADACKIAGCSAADFLNRMEEIGFSVEYNKADKSEKPLTEEYNVNEYDVTAELDVRPILAGGQDPLQLILKHIKGLEEGQSLKLINTFEPAPLIQLLAAKGFSHYTQFYDPDTVITYFQKDKPDDLGALVPSENELKGKEVLFDDVLSRFDPAKIKYIDVRPYEMPKPMLLILETIETLNSGEALFVFHKKRPVFLIPELEKQGFHYLFKDTLSGEVDMLIYKP